MVMDRITHTSSLAFMKITRLWQWVCLISYNRSTYVCSNHSNFDTRRLQMKLYRMATTLLPKSNFSMHSTIFVQRLLKSLQSALRGNKTGFNPYNPALVIDKIREKHPLARASTLPTFIGLDTTSQETNQCQRYA